MNHSRVFLPWKCFTILFPQWSARLSTPSLIPTVVVIPVSTLVCVVIPVLLSSFCSFLSLLFPVPVFFIGFPPVLMQVRPLGPWPPPNPISWSSYSANSSRRETAFTRSPIHLQVFCITCLLNVKIYTLGLLVLYILVKVRPIVFVYWCCSCETEREGEGGSTTLPVCSQKVPTRRLQRGPQDIQGTQSVTVPQPVPMSQENERKSSRGAFVKISQLQI